MQRGLKGDGRRTLYILRGSLGNNGMASLPKAQVNHRVKASPSGPSSLRTLSAIRSGVSRSQTSASEPWRNRSPHAGSSSQVVRASRSLRLRLGSLRSSCCWRSRASECLGC